MLYAYAVCVSDVSKVVLKLFSPWETRLLVSECAVFFFFTLDNVRFGIILVVGGRNVVEICWI